MVICLLAAYLPLASMRLLELLAVSPRVKVFP